MDSAEAPRTKVNLHRIVKTAVETVQTGLDQKSGDVQIEGRLPEVWGREDLLLRVIQNLLENAFQHRDPSRPLQVRIRAEGGTGAVRLFVADNGMGIPPEDRTRVFGLFERLHQETERPGSGLGLSIVKRAVEHMGGHVVIMDSPDGLGVTFALILPRPGGLSSSDLE